MAIRNMLWKKRDAESLPAAVREESIPEVSAPLIGDTERLAMLDAFETNEVGWFWATDALHTIIYLSDSAAAKFEAEKPAMGAQLNELVETAGEDGEFGGERPLSFFLGSRTKFRDLVVRLHCGDEEMWWSLNGRPHYDEEENFLGFRGSARDISEQFLHQRDVQSLVQFDTLTGLSNRHRVENRLETILSSFRAEKRSCALLTMDLDKFKVVNDTLGHPAGDELLRQVSKRLQRIVVAPAEIGRLGGDEFQIIIPDMDDRGHLGELAEKIIQMISQPYALEYDRAVIGTSIGIAISPFDGDTLEELVKSADLALYSSKASGRGQYRFFANDLADAARRQRELGEDLALAIRSDQLDMQYQPIVRADDNQVVAFEALLRWDHSEIGQIEPARFIAVAEDANLINHLAEWSLERACRDAAQWPDDIGVSVNISAVQFLSGDLPDTVRQVLKKTGLDSSRLELEITEGVFLGESHLIDRVFTELRSLGIRLALDDFGKGHSSLSLLRREPFDRIKIDQSFVRGSCGENNFNAAIISALTSLASAMGMQTTAEGVEALDELDLVMGKKVSHIQGFIFSRPVTQEAVLEKLGSGDRTYEPVGPKVHRTERRTVFRRIGVMHENHHYDAVLRNLSRNGALIEGIVDVPVGTDLVLDLGGGQLAVARVRRSQDATQGLEFETPLISDGASGLCTRSRVVPSGAAGGDSKNGALQGDVTDLLNAQNNQKKPTGKRRFMQVDITAGSSRAA